MTSRVWCILLANEDNTAFKKTVASCVSIACDASVSEIFEVVFAENKFILLETVVSQLTKN